MNFCRTLLPSGVPMMTLHLIWTSQNYLKSWVLLVCNGLTVVCSSNHSLFSLSEVHISASVNQKKKKKWHYAWGLCRRVSWDLEVHRGALTEENLHSSAFHLLSSEDVPCWGIWFCGHCLWQEEEKITTIHGGPVKHDISLGSVLDNTVQNTGT